MRNLRRRIEALEKSTSARHDVRQAIAESAVGGLRGDVLEALISAYGADKVGRPLTEREAAARRAYAEAPERECQSAGLHSTTGFGRTSYIRRAIIIGQAHRSSPEELTLALGALRASQQGRAPTEQESAAIQAWNSEKRRLCQLAGFGSVGEFNTFCSRAKSEEGGPC